MTEQELKTKGWIKGKRCRSCGGVIKYPYTNAAKPGYEIIVYPTRGLFTIKKDGRKKVSGTLVNLRHQYVLQ